MNCSLQMLNQNFNLHTNFLNTAPENVSKLSLQENIREQHSYLLTNATRQAKCKERYYKILKYKYNITWHPVAVYAYVCTY